jgi:hypothetical protein
MVLPVQAAQERGHANLDIETGLAFPFIKESGQRHSHSAAATADIQKPGVAGQVADFAEQV